VDPPQDIVQKDKGKEEEPTGYLQNPKQSIPLLGLSEHQGFSGDRASFPQYCKFPAGCNGVFRSCRAVLAAAAFIAEIPGEKKSY
jgi:hypothetical protein